MALVKNIHGTSDRTPPSPHESMNWLAWWEMMKGRKAYYCSCTSCIQAPAVGAHVKRVGSQDMSWYIVPLCKACNAKTDDFSVSESDLQSIY